MDDKAYVICCSNSHFFFSVGMVYPTWYIQISGEARLVPEEMIARWLETKLPTILSRYPFQDAFNADELGLFVLSMGT